MRRTAWRSVVAGAATVVAVGVVAGCDSEATGTALGDLRTIDSCGLIDLDGFAEYGTAALSHDSSLTDFGVCAIEIDADDVTINVRAGLIERLDDRAAAAGNRVRDLDDGLWVGEESEDSWCSRILVFPDDTSMDVTVYDSADEPVVDRCAVATTALDMIAGVVAAGTVPHGEPPGDSLRLIDPCELVPADTVAEIPEFEAVELIGEPSQHACGWDDDPGTTFVSVRFGFGEDPVAKGYGVTESEIAGRRSVTSKVYDTGGGSMAFCSVRTAHLPYDGVEDAVELAEVSVALPDTDEDTVCEWAERIAEPVWDELPTP